jgi:pimeloyl-ACP methyl ester carboxylesterase
MSSPEAGERGGGAPIVCVHGVTGHAECFRRLAQDTLADRRVLAMDLRGHGRSGWLPPWNIESHVGDLAETATGHAVEHATWIGFSLGGRLVAELALSKPELVDRLVLLEPMLQLPPQDGLEAAERERHEEAYCADSSGGGRGRVVGRPLTRRSWASAPARAGALEERLLKVAARR